MNIVSRAVHGGSFGAPFSPMTKRVANKESSKRKQMPIGGRFGGILAAESIRYDWQRSVIRRLSDT